MDLSLIFARLQISILCCASLQTQDNTSQDYINNKGGWMVNKSFSPLSTDLNKSLKCLFLSLVHFAYVDLFEFKSFLFAERLI